MWETIKKFVKKHPYWTAFILAGLITAGVFTAGMIFAPIILFGIAAWAGAGAVWWSGTLYMAANAQSYRGYGAFFAGAGIAVGCIICPPLGVAVLGAVLVGLIGNYFGKKNELRYPSSRPIPENQSSQSSPPPDLGGASAPSTGISPAVALAKAPAASRIVQHPVSPPANTAVSLANTAPSSASPAAFTGNPPQPKSPAVITAGHSESPRRRLV